jgi:hypothetical protein
MDSVEGAGRPEYHLVKKKGCITGSRIMMMSWSWTLGPHHIHDHACALHETRISQKYYCTCTKFILWNCLYMIECVSSKQLLASYHQCTYLNCKADQTSAYITKVECASKTSSSIFALQTRPNYYSIRKTLPVLHCNLRKSYRNSILLTFSIPLLSS